MAQPAPSLIAATVAELRRHAPFDAIDVQVLAQVAARLKLRYFAQDTVILDPAQGRVNNLLIVQRGQVEGRRSGEREAALSLTEGECFPLGAVLGRRATHLVFTASRDTFCYEMDGETFEDLMDRSREFRHFGTLRLSNLLEQSQRGLQSDYAARLSDLRGMARPLKSVLRRAPVTITPQTTIGESLQRMHELRIGSLVVVDPEGKPVGIFTERDVLDRVALRGADPTRPISDVMTANPATLPASSALFEAAQLMTRRRFRHVVVMEEGRLAGVISERDLFTLQRLSPGEISKSIHHAESVEELVHAAAEVRSLAGGMLAQGVAAEQLTQFVTTLNDCIVERAIALSSHVAAPPAVRWCWMGLGSEGRMEQTLATDQDNAILFVGDPANIREDREALLAFATGVNDILNQCGFPLCKGDIMARNPAWCLTEGEWRDRFQDWIRNRSPEALLNAAIFFDFRPLAGDVSLADSLRSWLNDAVRQQSAFLHLLAQNALQSRPPLGVLRDFVVDDNEHPGTIDLKRYGARPFIDAARIFALAHGVAATNTAERLRIAGPRMRLSAEELVSAIDGFHFIQMLRLRSSDAGTAGTDPHLLTLPANRVDPERMSALDRRILKEALRQARKLQSRLELDYQL